MQRDDVRHDVALPPPVREQTAPPDGAVSRARAAVSSPSRTTTTKGDPHGRQARRQDDRVPRDGRRRAGGAHGAVEGGARRRAARPELDLARGRRGPGLQPPRQGRHVPGRPRRRRRRRRPPTTGSCCRAAWPTPTSCARTRTPSRSCARSSTQAKPVAAICHGPWTLVEADVVRGRTITSWPSLQTDIRNAGGTWVDEEVHVDQGLVSSRKPDDLPGLLRQARRGVRRGRARGPARERERDRVSRRLLPPAAILDIDGTLVDTNYHHAIAWYRAFRRHGVTLPLYRIHRHIGMGGDQLVAALAGEEWDARARRRRARGRGASSYMELIDEVRPAAGRARAARGRCTSAATRSCSPPRRSRTRSSTTSTCSRRASWPTAGPTSGDVEKTKPEPDLVAAAVEKAGGGAGRHARRLDVGLQGRRARRGPDDRRPHRRFLRAGAAGGGRRVRRHRAPGAARATLDATPFGTAGQQSHVNRVEDGRWSGC